MGVSVTADSLTHARLSAQRLDDRQQIRAAASRDLLVSQRVELRDEIGELRVVASEGGDSALTHYLNMTSLDGDQIK